MQRIVDETFRRGRFATQFAATAILVALISACGSDDAPTAPRTISDSLAVAPQLGLSAAFDQYIFLLPTTDDAGANDDPAQSDLNSFTRADNISGRLAVAWTWDDINSWTGTGQTGDACALFDTDAVGTPASQGGGNADYALCVRINNPGGNPNVVAQTQDSPILYQCSDKKTDRCTTTFAVLPLGGSFCEVVPAAETFSTAPNVGDDGADVLAACSIALSAIGNPSRTSLLNVCSFPSGSPNSNNFDCVVTPGSGFIQIKKKTTPQTSGQTFSFTLNPAAAGGTTAFNILDNSANDETTQLIPVAPGTYSITESTIPSGWAVSAASCVGTGTKSGDAITGIQVAVGQTVACTFENTQSGSITIVKNAVPDDAQDFSYTATGTGVSNFTLDDDGAGGSATPSSQAFNSLAPGARTITEGAVSGWVITNIACSGNTSSTVTIGASGGFNAGDDAVTIDLAAGENVTCTFTNTKGGSITIVKNAVPDDAQDFSYTATGTGVSNFTLDDDGAGGSATPSSQAFNSLQPGSRTITEGAVSGWVITNIACTGNTSSTVTIGATGGFNAGDDAVTIDLAAGENITCTFTNTVVAPGVTVVKTASPTSIPETGGNVTYSVDATNNASVSVTLTTLSDDKFGNLDGQGTCDVPQTLAAGATYSCSFSKTLPASEAGLTHVNTVTATVTNAGGSAFDTDDATVTYTNVNPNISVTKSANPTTLSTVAAGVLTFPNPDRTWTTTPTSTPGVPSFVSPTCDDGGPNDINSAQVDLNCFDRADNVANKIYVKWTWDDIDEWGGSGSTGDACALLDTDNDGNANVAICARIQNDAQGNVVQIGGPGAADVYLCTDSKTDRCAKQVTPVTGTAKGTITSCTIGIVPDGFNGQGDHSTDVEATCLIDRTMPGAPIPAGADLLNVCSFPSGEPNSNPFDCVVEIGAGFIQIVKVASPTSTQQFGFTLAGPATDLTSKYIVAGGVTSALIPVKPTGGSVQPYSLTETLPTNWDISTASCVVDGQSTGTFSLANKRVTGITIKTGQTTICTFTNTGLISGNVEFTVRVTNLSKEDVTLFSLVDDQFGDLNGVGSCTTGGTIAGSAAGNLYYECKFTKTLTGAAGTSHENKVTAVGRDNENPQNEVTKTSAKVTVNFVSP